MKNLIIFIILVISGYYIYNNNVFDVKTNLNQLQISIKDVIKDYKKEVVVPSDNKYVLSHSFDFVSKTTDYIPDNKQELYNIYYTVLDSGWESFDFYCSDKYVTCQNDVNELGQNQSELSHLNSFVHPYNSFSKIKTNITNSGKISIVITKAYDNSRINELDTKINLVYNATYNPNKTIRDNIKLFHDYIINNTKYDSLKSTNINDATYQSDNAYGPLFQGYAVCSGYTDLMALFLYKMNVPNIKVATENHIWNLVNIDNKWYHLDLTWDDPVTSNNKNILIYSYFLIDYPKLKALDQTQHNFNQAIYKEAL